MKSQETQSMDQESKETAESFEKIGSWEVSAEIPKDIRTELRNQMDAYQRRELTDNFVLSHPGYRMFLSDLPHLPPDSREERIEEVRERMIARWRWESKSKENVSLAERLLSRADYDFYDRSWYLDPREYFFLAVPDPFMDMGSYFFKDQQPQDRHERVIEKAKQTADRLRKGHWNIQIPYLESGLIVAKRRLLPENHDRDLPQEYENLSDQSRALILISYKTRKARILPDPWGQSKKQWAEEQETMRRFAGDDWRWWTWDPSSVKEEDD